MIEFLKNIITQLPKENKDEFLREIYGENLLKLIVSAIILIIAETVISCLLWDQICNADGAIIVFILFNVIMLPVLYMVYKRINVAKDVIVKNVQRIYLFGALIYGCALTLILQGEFESIHVYIIVVFAIAAFIYMQPVESLIMYFLAYLVFCFVLPYYQTNTYIVTILTVNALIMNIIAWVLSRMVFRLRVKSFIDKKIILEQNLQLKDLSIRDSMTMLLNYKHIFEKLSEEIGRAKRIEYPLSIIMMDIDDFKYINDNYGHLTGDNIIIKVAQILGNTCRITDIIGRYGGEEFIIIMPGAALKDAAFLAERIRMTINTAEFEKGINITVSGGIREWQGDSAEELIKRVDQQLYIAKSKGKNRFETM
ncbi:GGDEF domain-containing protein [Pelotomaculum propionicicum]|uniref:Response regulator PleD n=1 Tax=Pelotomaculum propionicicum TaxID=258475 RepID=A0A4Y7RQ53_9FIRM|nr:GGDEF domain-containing protein [Pelotomaculum propionicicum]NLI14275.1 GGDEF domain-containing protein [Peptococcaceae bacterium]TEB10973.1 Response regulator PleD [Pelotomaculum propionicicum]